MTQMTSCSDNCNFKPLLLRSVIKIGEKETVMWVKETGLDCIRIWHLFFWLTQYNMQLGDKV